MVDRRQTEATLVVEGLRYGKATRQAALSTRCAPVPFPDARMCGTLFSTGSGGNPTLLMSPSRLGGAQTLTHRGTHPVPEGR
jgi:hypothetical protein